MKITFLGYDYTLDIAQRLIADGHEIMHVFTFPCDNVFACNIQIKEFTAHFNIPISEYKIELSDINKLIDNGCEVFICAGYPHKIPDIDYKHAFAINLHPTLLPQARGIMPLPYVIMKEPSAAGFTIHKLATDFDTGDILYQEAVQIDSNTDVETLSAKIATNAPNAMSDIVANINKYWNESTPQDNDKASSYPSPSTKMRTINWEGTPDELSLKGRSFGRFGVMAEIKNNMGQAQKLAIFNFTTWEEKHTHELGYLLRSSAREIIIAINGGYACLKEFQVIE